MDPTHSVTPVATSLSHNLLSNLQEREANVQANKYVSGQHSRARRPFCVLCKRRGCLQVASCASPDHSMEDSERDTEASREEGHLVSCTSCMRLVLCRPTSALIAHSSKLAETSRRSLGPATQRMCAVTTSSLVLHECCIHAASTTLLALIQECKSTRGLRTCSAGTQGA